MSGQNRVIVLMLGVLAALVIVVGGLSAVLLLGGGEDGTTTSTPRDDGGITRTTGGGDDDDDVATPSDAGDASGRVARLFNAAGDRAGVLSSHFQAARMPRPIMQSHAQMPWIQGRRKKRRIASSPGGSGGRCSTAVFPASEAGAIRISRSMFRKGGRAEPAGVWSSSCRWRRVGRASARRA